MNKKENWVLKDVDLDIKDCWVDVPNGTTITLEQLAVYERMVKLRIGRKAKCSPAELPEVKIVSAIAPDGWNRRFRPAEPTLRVQMQVIA
jgi:hypothetical protein